MPNFKPQSVAEARETLVQKLAKDDGQAQMGYIDDFARISSLLSDEAATIPYLRNLNDRLVASAAVDNYQQKVMKDRGKTGKGQPQESGPGREFQTKIGTQQGVYETPDVSVDLYYQKHHKVLSSFLNGYFYNLGFNKGGGSVVSAGRPIQYSDGLTPKLAGFVQPEEFRSNLLKVARHFKDPAVSSDHGEYTHQLQWYVVCEHMRKERSQFRHKSIEIYRECGSDAWKNGALGIWDLLFEGGLPSKDFRKAESFNEYLLLASRKPLEERRDIWFLTDLVMGRYAKRKKERGEI